MPNPGSLGSVAPNTLDHLYRKVAAQEKLINQLMTQRTLESAIIGKGGLTVQGGTITLKAADGSVLSTLDAAGVTVVGDLILNGTETVSGDIVSDNYTAGTDGFKLTGSTGNIEINDLTLRGGIIGNDALAEPLKSAKYFATSGGHAIPAGVGGTATDRADITVTIPAGFTSVLLFVTVQDGGWNDSGSADYLYSCINVGAPGTEWVIGPSATVPNLTFGSTIIVTTKQYTGLSGGDTISVQSRPFTSGATWSADPANITAMSALALFFR